MYPPQGGHNLSNMAIPQQSQAQGATTQMLNQNQMIQGGQMMQAPPQSHQMMNQAPPPHQQILVQQQQQPPPQTPQQAPPPVMNQSQPQLIPQQIIQVKLIERGEYEKRVKSRYAIFMY